MPWHNWVIRITWRSISFNQGKEFRERRVGQTLKKKIGIFERRARAVHLVITRFLEIVFKEPLKVTYYVKKVWEASQRPTFFINEGAEHVSSAEQKTSFIPPFCWLCLPSHGDTKRKTRIRVRWNPPIKQRCPGTSAFPGSKIISDGAEMQVQDEPCAVAGGDLTLGLSIPRRGCKGCHPSSFESDHTVHLHNARRTPGIPHSARHTSQAFTVLNSEQVP